MLFNFGNFILHSGQRSRLKIDCDALTEGDWQAVAAVLAQRLPPFGAVEGVPTGGLRLAEAMRYHCTYGPAPDFTPAGPTLLVDDVITTGASMEAQRAGRDCLGAVLFARRKPPVWVTALLVLGIEDV